MKVKICGITNPEDAAMAVEAGADFIGLNFVAGPRQIQWQAVPDIMHAIRQQSEVVALVRVSREGISSIDTRELTRHGITRIQPYGEVTPELLNTFFQAGLKVFWVQSVPLESFPGATQDFLNRCGDISPDSILLDAHAPGQLGGTGKTLDWEIVAKARAEGLLDGWPKLILAGGLTPENVGKAVQIVQPWAVDVSSGVEESPGKKNATKVRDFVHAAHNR